jgi:GTP cyclohydrolase I
MIQERLEATLQVLLEELELRGQHFKGTPERVARMWSAFLNPKPFITTTFETKEKTGFIIIKDHLCYSFCPHHLLPVKYTIKVGYLPKDSRILGLSKVARICDYQMHLLPVQEDLGSMIAKDLIGAIRPKGIGIIVHGEHMCMQMRGVESRCASATTTFMTGVLLEDQSAREEFLLL